MSNILIINGHQYYPFSEGKLNSTLVDKAASLLNAKGHNTRIVTMSETIDVERAREPSVGGFRYFPIAN